MKICLLLLAALIALSVGAKLPNRQADKDTDDDTDDNTDDNTDDELEPTTSEPELLITPKFFEDVLKKTGHKDFIDTKCYSLLILCWLDKAGTFATNEGVPVFEAYNYLEQCCLESEPCGMDNPMCPIHT